MENNERKHGGGVKPSRFKSARLLRKQSRQETRVTNSLLFNSATNSAIPKTLMPPGGDPSLQERRLEKLRVVCGMHQQKAEMARQAEAFIILPGGYGTLGELLEVITWAQLGIHDKPVGLLNVEGYYNSLLSFIDEAVDEGLISPSAHHIVVSAPTPYEPMSKLEVCP